jgi:hypothetical protein
VTGPAGPTGPAGSGGGAESGTATNFGKYTGAGATGGLASGKQESGGWQVNIHVAVGSRQQEASGVASFPIPLKHEEVVTLNYRDETNSGSAVAPCIGTVAEPVITPVGNFCAYRGTVDAGAKEKGVVGQIDKEAAFFGFQSFDGEKLVATGTAGKGDDGVLITFRTANFVETPLATEEKLTESDLHAIGSWAVAAK